MRRKPVTRPWSHAPQCRASTVPSLRGFCIALPLLAGSQGKPMTRKIDDNQSSIPTRFWLPSKVAALRQPRMPPVPAAEHRAFASSTWTSATRTMARTLPNRLHRELSRIEHQHCRRFRHFVKYSRRLFFHEIFPRCASPGGVPAGIQRFTVSSLAWLAGNAPGATIADFSPFSRRPGITRRLVTLLLVASCGRPAHRPGPCVDVRVPLAERLSVCAVASAHGCSPDHARELSFLDNGRLSGLDLTARRPKRERGVP